MDIKASGGACGISPILIARREPSYLHSLNRWKELPTDKRDGRRSEARTEVVHARLSGELKERLSHYAQERGMTMSAALRDLVESALDGDQAASRLSRLEQKMERIAKDCAIASKRAGKASQASLGCLALMCIVGPDAMRFLANEALLRGQLQRSVLRNDKAADNVRVPAHLGRMANAIEPQDLFRMAYSELGGKLSRDGRTDLLPALASAVSLFGLEECGLLGMDAGDWERASSGNDTEAMSRMASRVSARAHHA